MLLKVITMNSHCQALFYLNNFGGCQMLKLTHEAEPFWGENGVGVPSLCLRCAFALPSLAETDEKGALGNVKRRKLIHFTVALD